MTNPQHIAIILDGNRRYAKKLMKQPWKGHEEGANIVEKLMEWAKDLKVKELTLYSFSVDKFKRPKEEVENLLVLIKERFEKFYQDDRLDKEGIRVRFIGDRTLFSDDIQEIMNKVVSGFKDSTTL